MSFKFSLENIVDSELNIGTMNNKTFKIIAEIIIPLNKPRTAPNKASTLPIIGIFVILQCFKINLSKNKSNTTNTKNKIVLMKCTMSGLNKSEIKSAELLDFSFKINSISFELWPLLKNKSVKSFGNPSKVLPVRVEGKSE